MRIGILVVEATSLTISLEVSAHALSIVGKLLNPSILRRQKVERVVQNLFREFNQLGQALKRVAWWHLNRFYSIVQTSFEILLSEIEYHTFLSSSAAATAKSRAEVSFISILGSYRTVIFQSLKSCLCRLLKKPEGEDHLFA